jgi:hypothetical protein
MRKILFLLCIFTALSVNADDLKWLSLYNPIWKEQSKNAAESMPCGGGDIGMNVWVENNEVLFYISRSGAFDENNVFPKLGRVRLSFFPNPFEGATFRQELKLKDGYLQIDAVKNGKLTRIEIWANVFMPVIEVKVNSATKTTFQATYETWRYEPLVWNIPGQERASIAFRNAPIKATIEPDSVNFKDNGVYWYHHNQEKTIFDATVKQESLDPVKDELWNPLKFLTFGGYMEGDNMAADGLTSGKYIDTKFKGFKLTSKQPSCKHYLRIYLHTEQTPDMKVWDSHLKNVRTAFLKKANTEYKETRAWWNQFWQRSHIVINEDSAASSPSWQVGRNYQLFRYQLGCNAYGKLPTKFNGGLFTFDPSLVLKDAPFTPDHRDWGGGTHTAQNQRLVYWPMLKSGDTDMMPAQLDFYLNALGNAEARVRHYWNHEGACFTEQIDWYGLPMVSSYGWNRPASLDPGIQDNLWGDYEWDTCLEFCKMALDIHQYTGKDIRKYLPLVEKCLVFFDKHYQYLAAKRSRSVFDAQGKLILYPSTGCETYKMAYNSSNTIAALKSVTTELLQMPEDYLTPEKRTYYEGFLKRIPDIPFRTCDGHKTIAPAIAWQRIYNIEIPQLYPVFPWGLYGVGLPDLDVAVNTWKYGVDTEGQRNFISWHQDGIFCARLGLTSDAKRITLQKMTDSQRKYPTFWGPGHDWAPDHNWGGSGMIGLQEMLLQAVGDKIYIFPAWPKEWNVNFKLHAPQNTTIEGELKDGRLVSIHVFPASREKDLVICQGIQSSKADK